VMKNTKRMLHSVIKQVTIDNPVSSYCVVGVLVTEIVQQM
jgi:hypothetical protein